MTTEVIEGTAVEVEPARSPVVVAQPGQALVSADSPTGPWTPAETVLYLQGERLVERLRDAAEVQVRVNWEVAKAEFDALQSMDHDYHVINGFSIPDCDDCAEASQAYWTRNMASY